MRLSPIRVMPPPRPVIENHGNAVLTSEELFMLQWNSKITSVLMVALLVALAIALGNFTWFANFTW
jgi:hypothetical protein